MLKITAVHKGPAVKAVSILASEIWTEHYTPIVGLPQVEYMLSKFQTKEAILEQIKSGYLYYLIQDKDLAGYFAVLPEEGRLLLSKYYVKKDCRGRGYGRKALGYVEELAIKLELKEIKLFVNKRNTGSINAYKKLGFTVAGDVVTEVGGGFVMDDYVMVKHL